MTSNLVFPSESILCAWFYRVYVMCSCQHLPCMQGGDMKLVVYHDVWDDTIDQYSCVQVSTH